MKNRAGAKIARAARRWDGDGGGNITVLHHQSAFSQISGLGDAMGDKDNRGFLLLPNGA